MELFLQDFNQNKEIFFLMTHHILVKPTITNKLLELKSKIFVNNRKQL